MAKAAVAANLHQAGDVLLDLTTQVTLDGVGLVDGVAELGDLVLGKIADAGGGVDAGLLTNLAGSGAADAVDVGKTDLDALLAREVDTVDTGQLDAPLLALALLVARVLADHVNLAVTADDLALIAHLLDRRTYLHRSSSR